MEVRAPVGVVGLVVIVLILVTSHHVEAVVRRVFRAVAEPVVAVLRVHGELEVIAVRLLPTSVAEVVVLAAVVWPIGPLLTVGEVHAGVDVQLQVLEAMHLIVCLDVADKRARDGAVVLLLEHGHRVRRGVAVEAPKPIGVAHLRILVPLRVATEILVVDAVVGLHGLRGIHVHCRAYGSTVSVMVLCEHTLGVDIEGQVVVEERWREVEAARVAAEVGGLHDTLVVGEAEAHAVRHVGHAARHGHVVVVGNGCAIDFVLPVGVGEMLHAVVVGPAEGPVSVAVLAVEVFHELGERGAVHHVERVLLHGDGHVARIAHLRCLLALASLLRGDDDDTV